MPKVWAQTVLFFVPHVVQLVLPSINPPVKVTRTQEHTVRANGVNLTHILCFVLSGSHVFFIFFFSPSSLMSSMLLLCRLRSPVSAHIDFLSKRFLNP